MDTEQGESESRIQRMSKSVEKNLIRRFPQIPEKKATANRHESEEVKPQDTKAQSEQNCSEDCVDSFPHRNKNRFNNCTAQWAIIIRFERFATRPGYLPVDFAEVSTSDSHIHRTLPTFARLAPEQAVGVSRAVCQCG